MCIPQLDFNELVSENMPAIENKDVTTMSDSEVVERALSGFNFTRLVKSIGRLLKEERDHLEQVISILMAIMQDQQLNDQQAQIVNDSKPYYEDLADLETQLVSLTKAPESTKIADVYR